MKVLQLVLLAIILLMQGCGSDSSDDDPIYESDALKDYKLPQFKD